MSSITVHPFIYVLLGCPGSGKGTFAQAIKSEGYDHVSTGDIIRGKAQNDPAFGLKYHDAILNHVIGGIPFEVIQQLVEERLENAISERKGVILDGYPKTKEQCELLDAFIQKNELKGKVSIVLIEVEKEKAMDRILYRQTCDKCGKIYNSKFSPSKISDQCNECPGVLIKRMDNDALLNSQRIDEFEAKMHPVIEHYASSGRLRKLDGNIAPDVCLEEYIRFHRSARIS